MNRVVMILLALAVVAPAALAEETVLARAVRSCASDIDRFCARVQPGEGRLLGCLYSHGESISEQCGMALNEATLAFDALEEQARELYDACETERQSFCPTAYWGEGEVVKCLAMQSHTVDSVSNACRLVLEKHGVI